MSGRGKRVLAVVLGLVLVLGLAGWFGLRAWLESRVHAALDGLRPNVDVTYSGLELDFAARGLALRQVEARVLDGPILRADRALFRDLDLEHATPYFLDAVLKGFSAEDPVWHWRAPACDAELVYRYDPLARELDLRTLHVVQEGGFEAALSGRFGNMDMDRFLEGYYLAASLTGLELRYTDRSLLKRLLQQTAAQFRLDEAALTARVEAWLAGQESLSRTRGNSTAAAALEALRRFAKNPGELDVRLAPVEPVPILYLVADGNLPEMLSLLNAKIEAR